MSQAESFKSPIINLPRGPSSSEAQSSSSAEQHVPWRGSTTQRLEAVAPPPVEAITARPLEAITTFAWDNSPVALIEEVELQPDLDSRLVMLHAPGSAQATSYRLLQHRLLAQGDPHVIAVTSAEPAEGKTTCAANLALALAEAALSRVLLVDANLTRPGIAELFRFQPSDSFMLKLVRSEDATPPFGVASIGGVGLQLAGLPRGAAQGKRLDRALFAEAVRGLRSVYDYVIIDTASVLESADVHSVCQSADGVVVATRAGKSKRSRVALAIGQLEPARVIGSVLLDT